MVTHRVKLPDIEGFQDSVYPLQQQTCRQTTNDSSHVSISSNSDWGDDLTDDYKPSNRGAEVSEER